MYVCMYVCMHVCMYFSSVYMRRLTGLKELKITVLGVNE